MPTLSVLIPVHNELRTIAKLIAKVKASPACGMEKDIIVVDDGSTDGTCDLLKTIPGIRYVFHETNKGKGGALKTALSIATGDYVIFQDSDLEYEPEDYAAMLQPILDGKAPWTNGVRIPPLNDARMRTFHGWLNRLGNFTITWLTNVLYWHVSAEYEGCYKVFPIGLLKSVEIKTNDFDFDNELICKLLKRGLKPQDVWIRYYPRDYAQGKHINWKHGFKILGTIIRERFS